MTAALTVAALWVLFAGTHMVLSSAGLRARLVARLGDNGFLGIYTLVSFATFVPLVWFYFDHKHAGPLLWSLPLDATARGVLSLGTTVGFVMSAAALVTPSPLMVHGPNVEPRGIQHITRHGLFMGMAIWALMHLVANGFASDVAFFGGFVLFTLVGCRHQDARKLAAGDPEFRRFHDTTPFLPFTGRNTWRGLREISLPGLAAGVAAAVLLRVFHTQLFV